MTSLIRILSLLSALTATSAALSCPECRSETSSCYGSSVTCPSDSVCGSRYTEASIGGVRSLHRTCVLSTECNFKGTLSLQQRHIRGHLVIVTSCCNTDHCTPEIPALPTKSSNPNGVVCRSCMSSDSTWCYTSDTMRCTGDENMCLLQTNKVTGSFSLSTAIRGCATKSICDLGGLSEKIDGLSVDIKFTCTSGGLSAHKVVLTPAMVCLLLLKFFF
ncbi:phospholipase A2 inhibitor and Ly6/PLAUR domain-containing protein-like [Leptodactylus fuscus]|uniref:phospholipase A2 inhibitor and Ly6/PLAUR domain-containing protein-like n=1 Tax=Leptodactylus fuscus TaxID=238119 RepID=UPI003F4F221F